MKRSVAVMGRTRRSAVVPRPPGSERRRFSGSSTMPSGAVSDRSWAMARSTVETDSPRYEARVATPAVQPSGRCPSALIFMYTLSVASE
ncbi:hypothetical protein GCM10020254_86680 [Streptomyces goshikiensis]